MSPHRGELVDSGRRTDRAGMVTSPESGRYTVYMGASSSPSASTQRSAASRRLAGAPAVAGCLGAPVSGRPALAGAVVAAAGEVPAEEPATTTDSVRDSGRWLVCPRTPLRGSLVLASSTSLN